MQDDDDQNFLEILSQVMVQKLYIKITIIIGNDFKMEATTLINRV